MTVRDLMLTPFMKQAEILAGEDGLDRDVTWCVPDNALITSGLIMPRLLLLYTGDCRESGWQSILDAMDEPSGMLLFGGKAETFIKEEDFGWFSRRRLPLIRMQKHMKPLEFVKRFTAFFSSAFERSYWAKLWLKELCCSCSPNFSETVAGGYGYSPDADYCCMLLTTPQPEEIELLQQERLFIAAYTVLSRAFSAAGFPILSFEDEKELVLFLPWSSEHGPAIPYAQIEAAAGQLKNSIPEITWHFCIGSPAESLSEFPASYRAAKRTGHVIVSLKIQETVSFYDRWYMHMLLLKEPRKDLEYQMRLCLQPVLDRPELFETLTAYLTFDRNLKSTAEHLFIHVNTLKYRLQQISELLHCDLKSPETVFRLSMALTIEQYLRNQ